MHQYIWRNLGSCHPELSKVCETIKIILPLFMMELPLRCSAFAVSIILPDWRCLWRKSIFSSWKIKYNKSTNSVWEDNFETIISWSATLLSLVARAVIISALLVLKRRRKTVQRVQAGVYEDQRGMLFSVHYQSRSNLAERDPINELKMESAPTDEKLKLAIFIFLNEKD